MLKMLKRVITVIKERAPDKLLALTIILNWLLHLRHFYILIPGKVYWIVRVKGKWLFIPARYTGQSMEPQVLIRKYFLPPKVIVEDGDIVFDVGAFIGGFTLAVMDRAKRVIAIEPDPVNNQLLSQNLKEARNVTIVQKAAWNNDSVLSLYLTYDPTSSSLLKPATWFKKVLVEAIRLDTLMYKLGIDRIDFLKIDAEGAEPEVLEGVDLSKVKKVAVDCSPERFGKPTVSEVVRILRSAGFECKVIGYMVYAHNDMYEHERYVQKTRSCQINFTAEKFRSKN
jgi:FkbM family methyltransferase